MIFAQTRSPIGLSAGRFFSNHAAEISHEASMAGRMREDLLSAGLAVFDCDGFEGATVASIRKRARASNGSFFHVFASKKDLAGALFLDVLGRYHAAILAALDPSLSAKDGIGRLIGAHLDWVVNNRREARFLFEISRSEWAEAVREAQRAENARFSEGIERWRAPLVARGELLAMTPKLFLSQIVGPAQIFCRAWLSGRDRADPRSQADILIACAVRALASGGPS
jgi:AcrR family transcriptional regulator